MGRFLTREDILAVSDITTEILEVEDWGGAVRIRGLTGNERDNYEQSIITMRGNKVLPKFVGARARLVARSVVDESGKLLFSEDDVAALGRKSAAALERVYAAARKLSGLTEEDVEELLGNSDGVQSEPSTSDSRSPSDAPSPNSSTPSPVAS
ncbi:MAG: hypothetical protein M3P43_13275 [Actinomycetota bacterium]|nr:hypothetical protein [Actinomycetota bacterium]